MMVVIGAKNEVVKGEKVVKVVIEATNEERMKKMEGR